MRSRTQVNLAAQHVVAGRYLTSADADMVFIGKGLADAMNVKVGDRLEVRRDGKAIGRVVVSTVKDSFSVGAFEGSGPARIGDAVGAP